MWFVALGIISRSMYIVYVRENTIIWFYKTRVGVNTDKGNEVSTEGILERYRDAIENSKKKNSKKNIDG